MADPTYVPVPFPSVVYPSSPNEPARTVQNAAELVALNTALATAPTIPPPPPAVQFSQTPTVTPKPANGSGKGKQGAVNTNAPSFIQNRQLRDQ